MWSCIISYSTAVIGCLHHAAGIHRLCTSTVYVPRALHRLSVAIRLTSSAALLLLAAAQLPLSEQQRLLAWSGGSWLAAGPVLYGLVQMLCDSVSQTARPGTFLTSFTGISMISVVFALLICFLIPAAATVQTLVAAIAAASHMIAFAISTYCPLQKQVHSWVTHQQRQLQQEVRNGGNSNSDNNSDSDVGIAHERTYRILSEKIDRHRQIQSTTMVNRPKVTFNNKCSPNDQQKQRPEDEQEKTTGSSRKQSTEQEKNAPSIEREYPKRSHESGIKNIRTKEPETENIQLQAAGIETIQPQEPKIENIKPQEPATENIQPQEPRTENIQTQEPIIENIKPRESATESIQLHKPEIDRFKPKKPETGNLRPQGSEMGTIEQPRRPETEQQLEKTQKHKTDKNIEHQQKLVMEESVVQTKREITEGYSGRIRGSRLEQENTETLKEKSLEEPQEPKPEAEGKTQKQARENLQQQAQHPTDEMEANNSKNNWQQYTLQTLLFDNEQGYWSSCHRWKRELDAQSNISIVSNRECYTGDNYSADVSVLSSLDLNDPAIILPLSLPDCGHSVALDVTRHETLTSNKIFHSQHTRKQRRLERQERMHSGYWQADTSSDSATESSKQKPNRVDKQSKLPNATTADSKNLREELGQKTSTIGNRKCFKCYRTWFVTKNKVAPNYNDKGRIKRKVIANHGSSTITNSSSDSSRGAGGSTSRRNYSLLVTVFSVITGLAAAASFYNQWLPIYTGAQQAVLVVAPWLAEMAHNRVARVHRQASNNKSSISN